MPLLGATALSSSSISKTFPPAHGQGAAGEVRQGLHHGAASLLGCEISPCGSSGLPLSEDSNVKLRFKALQNLASSYISSSIHCCLLDQFSNLLKSSLNVSSWTPIVTLPLFRPHQVLIASVATLSIIHFMFIPSSSVLWTSLVSYLTYIHKQKSHNASIVLFPFSLTLPFNVQPHIVGAS